MARPAPAPDVAAAPYRPSPRPTFSGPAGIPRRTVQRHVWGDPLAGEVSDWIYVSSEQIHALVFGLAPARRIPALARPPDRLRR